MEFIGIIPAAGLAKRLGDIPSSKEILPFKTSYGAHEKKRVFAEFLLEAYKLGGIQKVHFVIRKGKWDIPEYFGNGADCGMNLSYLIIQYTYGVPFTLYEAVPFIEDKIVALGFPDIVFSPKNAYQILYDKINTGKADVVLGLFPIETKAKWDMVDMDGSGRVTDILIKKKDIDLKYGWTIAVWGPAFTRFLKQEVEKNLKSDLIGQVKIDGNFRELYPGDIIKEAISQGLHVDRVIFEDGKCIDLGTKDDLQSFRDSPKKWGGDLV